MIGNNGQTGPHVEQGQRHVQGLKPESDFATAQLLVAMANQRTTELA